MDAAGPSLLAGRGGGGASEQLLQVKIQRFDEKMGDEKEEEVGKDSPAPQRCYSLSQAVREERREMRFNRSVWMSHHFCCLFNKRTRPQHVSFTVNMVL